MLEGILPVLGNMSAGAAALFCGIVAIINGKDKQNKSICRIIHEKTDEKFAEGQTQFAEIKIHLQYIRKSIDDLKLEIKNSNGNGHSG